MEKCSFEKALGTKIIMYLTFAKSRFAFLIQHFYNKNFQEIESNKFNSSEKSYSRKLVFRKNST